MTLLKAKGVGVSHNPESNMGVKAAGGVRDLDGLKTMVAAGATRIGASAGVRIVQESRGQAPTAATKGY